MHPAISYFEILATKSKIFANSQNHRTFAKSIAEFENLSKSVLKVQDFCLCTELDMADWINRNGAETEMLPLYLYVTKKCSTTDFNAQMEIKAQARLALIHLYSRMAKDMRENPIVRTFDLANKMFDYLNGERGDLFGAMLTIPLKIPIVYTYNPTEWNS